MFSTLKAKHAPVLCLTAMVLFLIVGIGRADTLRRAPQPGQQQSEPQPAPKPALNEQQEVVPNAANQRMPDTGQTGAAAEQEQEREEFLTLPDGPANSLAQGSDALVLPEAPQNLRFAEGTWKFDRNFIGSDGKPVHTSFAFDANGHGTSTITTADNERFTAEATARVDDGALKIQTGRYTNAKRKVSIPGMFVECRNVDGVAICKGSDGWKLWTNEHLLATDSIAAANARQAAQDGRKTPAGAAQANADTSAAGENGQSANGSSRQNPGAEAAQLFAELFEGGAELPPAILEQAEKAKAKSGASPLEGHWRYSRDFARKSDGGSVGLEFHFDKDGKGYSVIKDAAKGDAKAKAEAFVLPNGNLRVKTESYAGSGGSGYYPTFMECRPGRNRELDCDVTNGWTRINNGVLVSLDSINRQEKQANMEELMPSGQTARQDSAAGAASSAEDVLAAMQEQMEASARREVPKESKEQLALVLPKESNSMDFLKGRWRCNTGLVRTSDRQPVVVDFSFDGNGNGNSAIREMSGKTYQASARATYKNGRLRINTSDFYSSEARDKYMGQYLECRQSGARALCSGRSRDGSTQWQNATFTRIR